MLETFTFQAIASVALPSLIIHQVMFLLLESDSVTIFV